MPGNRRWADGVPEHEPEEANSLLVASSEGLEGSLAENRSLGMAGLPLLASHRLGDWAQLQQGSVGFRHLVASGASASTRLDANAAPSLLHFEPETIALKLLFFLQSPTHAILC